MEEVTIKDIARLCGVGVSTVSRAINNHPDINEATKAKVMDVIRNHNYVPNNSARNLKRAESKAIAVLIKGIGNPFFHNMIKVMEREIQKKKYSFILQRVESHEDEIEAAAEIIKEKRLKGIIFLGGSFTHTEKELEQLTVPFVLSTIEMKEGIKKGVYASVSVNNVKESHKMVKYLCECGHQKIAVLASDKNDNSIGKLRLDGYKQALAESQIPYDDNIICYSKGRESSTYSMENGYQLMQELMKKEVEFTAVYAISDSMAIGACKAILEGGKRIPEDYAVAGFDGLEIGYYYHPSITTVQQPIDEMAEETVRILFDLIKGVKTHQHKIFNGTLLVRESTKLEKEGNR